MASQHMLRTAPSEDAILNSLLELASACNACMPRLFVGLDSFDLDAEMPLLLNLPTAPLACREPAAEFEAVNAHFSAQVHAFFNAVHKLEDMADKQSPDELDLIRRDEGLRPVVIRVADQSFDIYPDCLHRYFHSRRLTVENPDKLPLLSHGTQLRVLPDHLAYSSDTVHMRPVSLRTPLELATRLPRLRELDCPWLWERLPVAFMSRAVRRFARVWEGPWRDDRVEFGRGVRHVMPLLPSSLTKVRLWFWKPDSCRDQTDQAAHMPDLVGASSSSTTEFDGMDPVSLGLRELGSRLEELDIRALITSDLFPSSARDGLSCWPLMRHLKVEFHPCSPDGSWYFSGPRGEDPHATGFVITREEHSPPGQEDDDETHTLWSDEQDEDWGDEEIYDHRQPDMFRTLPIAERINPLLLAFVSSLQPQKMPSLQNAELFTWLTWRPGEERAREYEGTDDALPSTDDADDEETTMLRWGVKYDAPEGMDGKGKVTWQVGEDWTPKDEVIRAFEHLVGDDMRNMEWKPFDFVGERDLDPDDYI